MELLIEPTGNVRCVYDDSLPLQTIGVLTIRRGSHVEPTDRGEWTADLSPVGGPLLGPFDTRSAALAAERSWLDRNWLTAASGPSSPLNGQERPAISGHASSTD